MSWKLIGMTLAIAAACGAPAPLPVRAAHPRLGLNVEALSRIEALRKQKSPVWIRFQEWMDRERTGNGLYVYSGGEQSAALLGYAVTHDPSLFQVAMKILAPTIWRDPAHPEAGLRPFFGKCPEADYCDDHSASSGGGERIYHVALLYDWAYAALSPSQRSDIVNWLNAAVEFNNTRNPWLHAHFRNDGAYIMLATAAAAYGTTNENPRAPQLMSWFRESWKEAMEALDAMGQGGALAEGNAYGVITGGALVMTAGMAQTAAGEDLFTHPWFKQRLSFDAFSVYPNAPQAPAAPYEGAALGGDDARGFSWHSMNMRPMGMTLARHFAGSPEADLWNWVFRQPEIDTAADAWIDLFTYSDRPKLKRPEVLSHYDPSLGYIYVRSDWKSRDATWISSWAGPHFDAHQHLDQGAFTIFKRRDLAIKSGNYDYNPLTPHSLNYYTRTLSSNGLLIGNPREFAAGFVAYLGCDAGSNHDLFMLPDRSAKVCIVNDGGERTMYPHGMSILDMNEWRTHREVYETAHVTSFRDTGSSVVWSEDLTNAYANPRFAATGTLAKVSRVWRRFAYLRGPDVLVVQDDVTGTDENFRKSWLLHAVDRVEVGGTVREVVSGESLHSGVKQALFIVDDRHPSNEGQTSADLRQGYAQLKIEALLPENSSIRLTGGREATPQPHGPQGDSQPGELGKQHLHRHIRDFWVHDYSEGVLLDHRSANWAPIYPGELVRTDVLPVFVGGYGRWRIAVEPDDLSRATTFLNVLTPAVAAAQTPSAEKFETAEAVGVVIRSHGQLWKVTFGKGRLEDLTVSASGK